MRTVLIGSDFMYDKDGNLKPIEINTNVGWTESTVETYDSVLDLTSLSTFITSNEFTSIVYIGSVHPIDEKLKTLCNELGITYSLYGVSSNSITIPFVEDNDQTLIIRSAYDTTALVDDTYCRDKVNFLNLIKDSTFGSQFAYLNESNTIVNNITTINDNGNHPNFILKSVLPDYDKEIYPKLYKISSQEELNTLISNMVTSDYFLMEYHYNSENLHEGIIPTYRGLNLLYPPSLESISLGGYTYLAKKSVDELSTFDSETFEISSIDKIKYISDDGLLNNPKLLSTDKVEMADGTFKTGEELQIGDLVKTINIPNPNNVDLVSETTEFNISYAEFLSGSTYTSKQITNKVQINKISVYDTITFTDGTIWEDVDGSSYLSLRNDNVRFLRLYSVCSEEDSCLLPGDSVILIDTTQETPTPVLKEVQTIVTNKIIFSGYEITVQDNHMFLTMSEDNTSSYVAIEHNVSCTGCGFSCLQCNCPDKGDFCTTGSPLYNPAIMGGGCTGTCAQPE
jgi:hypothetical protein